MTPRRALISHLNTWIRVRLWWRSESQGPDPLVALAEYVETLREDDPLLLELGTLAVRHGIFWPGPAVEDTLLKYTGGTGREEMEGLMSTVSRLASRDAVKRARRFGVLP